MVVGHERHYFPGGCIGRTTAELGRGRGELAR
jgi:hypothetical protein